MFMPTSLGDGERTMSQQMVPVLVTAVVLSLLIAIWLFTTKVVGHLKRKFDLFRRASYIGLLSEIATRAGYPLETLRSCAEDRVFLDTLMDFLDSVKGSERTNLVHVARELGIVERFVLDLSSRRRERRVVAARALAELGDPRTADALMGVLTDRVPEVRLQAADALAQLGEARAVEPLIELLERETEWNASRIADALVKLGSQAVPGLSEHLKETLGDEKGRAPLVARVLGAIGDVAAEPALIEALKEGAKEARIRSAAALRPSGTPSSVPVLIQVMDDPVWEVRAQAARTLGERMDPISVPVLRNALRDQEWWVRRNAAESLAQLPGGVDALEEALEDDDVFARETAKAQLMLSHPAVTQEKRVV
jgi:HEAT repeat protein